MPSEETKEAKPPTGAVRRGSDINIHAHSAYHNMVSLIYITYYKQILSYLADSYWYAVEIQLISGTIRREKTVNCEP